MIVFAVAFSATYIMVPVSKKIAYVIGAIDYPGNRRINTEPVPRCGGIALYVGFLAAFAVVFVAERFFGWEIVNLYVVPDVNYLLLFVGITTMFAVGLVDDITQLSPPVKFVGQIVAAGIVAAAGISIGTVRSILDSTYIDLGWLDYPLTVLYLVVFVNIINLIDGLDGLAAGIVAIVTASFLFLVFQRGSFTLVMACLALMAACLAFLRFNFYPASIFMGDSGSHFLGLMVGIISIAGIVRTQSLVVLLVPLVIAGVPVLDTFSAIIRRRRVSQPIKQRDLGHLHHRLLKTGMGQLRSVLLLYLCSAALAVCGLMIGSFSGLWRWAVFAVLAIVMFFIIWKFGLFKPVLRHYYDNKGKRGPRNPRS